MRNTSVFHAASAIVVTMLMPVWIIVPTIAIALLTAVVIAVHAASAVVETLIQMPLNHATVAAHVACIAVAAPTTQPTIAPHAAAALVLILSHAPLSHATAMPKPV